MLELSLHILDIVQNSIQAEANCIEIEVCDKQEENIFSFHVKDDGCGMNEETLAKITNPFYTSKNKKTGLGIPLLKQHAEACEGGVVVESEPGKGTLIKAEFSNNHIDRQPLGNIVDTVVGIIRANAEIQIRYVHCTDQGEFILDTEEIKQELQGLRIDNPDVLAFLKEMLNENIAEIEKTN